MAAKFLHSFTDDTAELQRQMGCMNGIFQLFDRQRMLTGGRRISGYSSKGNHHLNVRNSECDLSNSQLKSATLEKYSSKNTQDRQKIAVGSSRASFSSSSCSSSFSSFDYARVTQLESASFDKTMYPENPSRDSATGLRNSSPPFVHQNHDIRDFVKDSMYRELPALKAKVTDGSNLDRKQSTPADAKKYLEVLAKFQDGAQYSQYRNEPRELFRSSSYRSKDISYSIIARDAPRLSYDGREVSSAAFDSYDSSKSFARLKELRRPLPKDIDGANVVQGQRQRTESEAQRPSLIAKLMGLEAIPDSSSSINSIVGSGRSCVEDGSKSILSPSEETSSKKPVQLSGSCLNSWKEPNSPNWRRNLDSSVKPAAFFPIEPAPWKHNDVAKSSRKPASKVVQSPVIPSVYSEIDERLDELEFLQSGKDLRALKQILGTMQGKVIPEAVKEGQFSNLFSDRGSEQKVMSYSRAVDSRELVPEESVLFARRKMISLQNNESPIVIMKPAKYIEKTVTLPASGTPLDNMLELPKQWSGEPADNRKRFSRERTSSEHGNSVTADSMKGQRTSSSVKSQQLAKDRNASSTKVSGSTRPRSVHKKIEQEKRYPSPTSPDSSRSRRHPNQQRSEVTSPSRRRRKVTSNLQQSDDQKSVSNTESMNLCPSEVEDSAQSSVSTDSKNVQIMGSEASPRINNIFCPTTQSTERIFSGFPEKESTITSSEEESAESGFVPPEYSSPVSVLDGGARKLDTSPVKYVGKALKVDASADEEKNPSSKLAHLIQVEDPDCMEPFSKKKLQNVENLVLKLRRMNLSHDESRTDYIALLCDNTNPDHRYISEILLASGILLRSLTDFHFHPSGHPINPELFLVLEQTKGCTSSQGPHGAKRAARNHRKLVFDTVNEILAKKLSCLDPHSQPISRSAKTMSSQMLLRDLCSEIDALQAGIPRDEQWKSIITSDMMKTHPSERWVDFKNEISGAVLDIERMIFKDLVNEIIVGGVTA